MKHLFASLLVFLTLSCSNDDDTTSQAPLSERIIGEWHLIDKVNNGENIGIEVCELSTEFKINDDFSFTNEVYEGDNIDDCESFTYTGTWEFIEVNEFSFYINQASLEVILQLTLGNNDDRLILTNPEQNSSEIYERQ